MSTFLVSTDRAALATAVEAIEKPHRVYEGKHCPCSGKHVPGTAPDGQVI